MDFTSYSPTSENLSYPNTYENAYLADSYVPDYSFNTCDNDLFFEPAISSAPQDFWSPSQSTILTDSALSASTLPSTVLTNLDAWPNLQSTPFGEPGDLSTAFTAPETIKTSTSPCLSPRSMRRRSPSSCRSDHHSEVDDAAGPPPRKRGRPRLYRQSSGSSDSASEKAAYPQRLPHHQVERKYREGLNMELERLRRAVPTLPQGDGGSARGAAKPSKAMVLAAAIEYIKKMEKERDEAWYEVKRVREGAKIPAK